MEVMNKKEKETINYKERRKKKKEIQEPFLKYKIKKNK
jgi:hypothetical protein